MFFPHKQAKRPEELWTPTGQNVKQPTELVFLPLLLRFISPSHEGCFISLFTLKLRHPGWPAAQKTTETNQFPMAASNGSSSSEILSLPG